MSAPPPAPARPPVTAARSVVQSAKLIGLCTLTSRITGLVRDILLAQAFGLGWVQDAFSYGFTIPNLFRRLFGEGAMAPVFVPTFTRTLEQEGKPAAWALLARTLALLTLALTGVLTLIAIILAVVWLLFPADPLKLSLTAVMLPFMLTVCVMALLSAILNCMHSFVPAAFAPIILNLCMIAALLWIAPAAARLAGVEGSRALAYEAHVVAVCVVAAGVLQVLFLLPALRRQGVVLGWRADFRDPTVRRMLRLLGPVALGQGVLAFGVFLDAQICTMLTHVQDGATLASWFGLEFRYPLEAGALSALTYAQRLYQFPLGVLVIALATAALPAFSRLAARGAWGEWAAEVRQDLRLAVYEGIMAGTMMIVLAVPLVRLLFERGNFTPADTARAAYVLIFYGIALWAFCAQHIVQRAFYSTGDVRTPLVISAVLLPVNVALSVALVWHPAIREAAFALSSCVTSGAAVVAGAIILGRRTGVPILDGRMAGAVVRMLIAAAGAGLATWFVEPRWAALSTHVPGTLAARAVATLGPLALGTLIFLTLSWALRLPEVKLLAPQRVQQLVRSGPQ